MNKSFKFFLFHKAKIISIIMVMLITVFSIYFVTSLVQSIFTNVEYSNTACLNSFSLAYPVDGGMFIDEETVDKIKEEEAVGEVISAQICTTVINNIFGTTGGHVVFTEKENIERMFEKSSLELIEGRFPTDNEYEILMHENMLKNKGLSIGDKMGTNVDNSEYLDGEYKIVGSFSGEAYMAFGIRNSSLDNILELGGSVEGHNLGLVIYPKDDLVAMNSFLDNFEEESTSFITLSSSEEIFEENTRSIKFLLAVVVFAIAVCVSIALCVVLQTLYNERMSEFAILYAIGYRKKWIIKNIIGEMTILIFVSWMLGIFCSFAGLGIINNMIFKPMGQPFEIISYDCILYTILVLLVFSLTTLLSVAVKISKKDLISTIEMR